MVATQLKEVFLAKKIRNIYKILHITGCNTKSANQACNISAQALYLILALILATATIQVGKLGHQSVPLCNIAFSKFE